MCIERIAVFVLVRKTDGDAVRERLNKSVDGMILDRIPVFDCGLESRDVGKTENAEEILKEIVDTDEED